MELSLDNLGGLAHPQAAGELLSPAHARPGPHRGLVGGPARPAMVSGVASLLESGAADYRAELAAPLHPAMSLACDSPGPALSLSGSYTTLTPLQHLPPISAVSDKFHPHPPPHPHHHPHPHHPAGPPPHGAHPHQRLPANVSGSFTLMRDDRGLASVGNLYGHYAKDVPAMGQPLSPLANGLGPLHGGQQPPPPPPPPPPPLATYGTGPHLAGEKMLSAAAFEPHAAMLARAEDPLGRGLGAPGAGLMAPLNGLGAHGHHAGPGGSASGGGGLLAERERQAAAAASGSQAGSSGQVEEINTKEVAQRITAELKRYSIPQAIFAQRILCRSQGTLSDLLRNPKPWSKLKSGRETFRRMWKWLQEPEFQRMSALRLAGRGPGRVQGGAKREPGESQK
ncbi:one cut domain family member 3 [Sarcophilus harrisii]|uniref:one cut domain family member 3 n=1 Tax=Sarcophilus harrisii TaxID=9305 RepID=UPI001301EB71|nr:one cut domain family member 3 [Sarcophilus harrisii]